MATSVKKERSRRTSWLSPMWRDIDSLRKQNESTKKEIESMRRKSKQTETETEQLRKETEILKRQNKALELIESSDLNALLREATIPGGNDSDHPEAQLDLELLEEKLVALGCDVDDIPFLFDVLELTKEKELSAPRKKILSIPASQGQASRRNNSCIKKISARPEIFKAPEQNLGELHLSQTIGYSSDWTSACQQRSPPITIASAEQTQPRRPRLQDPAAPYPSPLSPPCPYPQL